jgi:hypothetical protein
MVDFIWLDEYANIDTNDIKRFRNQYEGKFEEPPPPPAILSIEQLDPHFHPCYMRVGVRIDGEERNDIAYYNTKNLSYKTNRHTSHLAVVIEPYWRHAPSRQQRRAEERWEAKRKKT